MLIFNTVTEDEDDFNIDNNTKNIFIVFCGFFSQEKWLLLKKFENDLNIISCLDEEVKSFFKSDKLITAHKIFTAQDITDASFILPVKFSSKEEASSFFREKMESSEVNKSLFCEVDYLDSDKIESYMKNLVSKNKEKEETKNVIEMELNRMFDKLTTKYESNRYALNLLESYKNKIIKNS